MMGTIALYAIKSGALVALFYIAYYLLLRRETFFKSNRWYLLFGLVTSMLLPLVTFKKVVWVEPEQPAANWSKVALSELDPIAVASVVPQAEPAEIDWFLVTVAIYSIVALALIVKFIRDFYSLRKLLKGKTVQRQSDYKFVDVPENVAPFSYFSYIVYNSSLYSTDELVNILEHEKVHSAQQHTLDVLLARCLCIAFWWNPFIWLYKKAILQNLEFIADSEAAKKISDLKSYQFTLLKITTHESCVAVTNHFFQSLIKKRIVMLNKNQSSKWNSWKYLLIVPALAAFLFYFQVKVIAQQRDVAPLVIAAQQGGIEVVVDKNTSDAELKNHAEILKKEHGIRLKFSKVKRNSNGEITSIKAEFKDQNGKKGTTMVRGDKPIEPIRFFKEENGTIGFGGRENFRFFGKHPNVQAFTFSGEGEGHSEGHGEDLDIAVDVDNDFDLDFDFDLDIDSLGTTHKVIVTTRDGDKRTVIVNGKEITGEEADKIIADAKPVRIKTFSRSKDGNEDVFITVNGNKIFSSDDARAISSNAGIISRKAAADVRKAIEVSKPEFERAKAEMKKAAAEMKRAHKQAAAEHWNEDITVKGYRKQEMEEARQEIEAARAEIKKAQDEIQKMRAEMDKERQERAKQEKP